MTKEETKLDKWYTASRDRVFKAVFVNDELQFRLGDWKNS